MDAAKLFEGIALLIDLAQRGEIDPWDVQVIDVIDRYLSKLVTAGSATQAAYEADLSQSGQAFLSASMLVLFKANTLIEIEQKETDLAPLEDVLSVEDGVTGRRSPLEQQLHRRPTALPPQKRRVTLQELIDQLQLMALQLQSEADTSTKTTRKSHYRSQSRAQALRALELAHHENLTEVARELEQVLDLYSHRILEQEDWLDLDQLVEFWTQAKSSASTPTKQSKAYISSSQQNNSDAVLRRRVCGGIIPPQNALEESISPPTAQESISPPTAPETSNRFSHPQTQDRVSVFWALLLLSAQSKVELSQEEFYQEIKIRTLQDSALSDRSQEHTGVLPDCVE